MALNLRNDDRNEAAIEQLLVAVALVFAVLIGYVKFGANVLAMMNSVNRSLTIF